MTEHHMLALSMACLLLVSCALVTPLGEIRKERRDSEQCTGARCSDAAVLSDRVRDASVTHDASEAAVPLNDAAPACDIPPDAECNPLAQCPCEPGTECGLDEQDLRVRCVPKHTGNKPAGERCASSSECATGLHCDDVNLCARFCASDDDCDGHGKCHPYEDARTHAIVAAASSCSRWCDLQSATECTEESSCYPGELDGDDPTSSCGSFHDSTRKQRGERCTYNNECDRMLMCAKFGPNVCTSFCKTDDDCSGETKHCYSDFVQPLSAAPETRVGQCIVWPCDTSTIGEPTSWTQGPVWNLEQSMACATRCARFNANCYRDSCTDGRRWRDCYDIALGSCAAATGSPCREKYVAWTCTDADLREKERITLENCLEQQADCITQAQKACGEQAPDLGDFFQ